MKKIQPSLHLLLSVSRNLGFRRVYTVRAINFKKNNVREQQYQRVVLRGGSVVAQIIDFRNEMLSRTLHIPKAKKAEHSQDPERESRGPPAPGPIHPSIHTPRARDTNPPQPKPLTSGSR